jgi:hypothetical protein
MYRFLNNFEKIFCGFTAILFCELSVSQNIGIGTINPNPSVGLHIDFTDKGV